MPDRTRWRVFHRDGWRCAYCKTELFSCVRHEHPQRATVDHKEPRWLGGSNKMTNLLAACHHCNTEKGSTPYEVWVHLRH